MKFLAFLKGVLAVSVGVSIVASHTVYADNVHLRMHTYYGTEIDDISQRLRDSVSEASNGAIDIQFFRGGELVDSDQFVGAVSRGTIDIAHGVGSYWPDLVDIGNIESGLPGAWVSSEEAHDIFEHQGLGELVSEAYEEQGVRLIGRGYGSDYGLLTREPVTSLDELRSMRISATSSVAAVLDIPTVLLSAQEFHAALSTGMIDGVIYGGPIEYEQLGLHEVAGYYTDINLLSPGWVDNVLINPNTWESLSEEHQEILVDGIDQYLDKIHEWLEEGNQSVTDNGQAFEFSSLSEDDAGHLTEAAQVIWQEEAGKSDRNALAIEILVDNAIREGRLRE